MNRVIREDIEGMLTRGDLDKLAGKSILISGANSFLMSYFIYLLLENNRENGGNTTVLALCRSRENAQTRFGDYFKDPHLRLLIQDVREPVRYDGAIDVCIHAASPAGIQSRQESQVDTFQINQLGCQNLLELAREKRSQRFLLLSSVDVYGSFGDRKRRKETDIGCLDWTYSRNAYSCGKRCAETLCALYYAQYDLPCVVVRPFQVYGPGMSLTDGRLHGDFIRQMREHNQIVLKSDGSAIRSFMYITDATHALLDVLLYGTVGETYNVCDEAGECSVKDLAKRYAAQKESNLDKLLFVWRDGQELTRNPKFREYIQYSDNFEQWKKVIQAHFNCIERNDFQTTADNIEAAMENCGFVISGRFHGIAAAIQKGIPCIAIDICPKIRALMEDCGLKEYCIKVSETDKLGELITRAKAEYRDIRKKQQDYKAKANLTLLKHIEVVKEAIDRALHPLRAIHYGSYWMGENDVVKAMADDLGDVFISQVIDLKAYSSHSDTRIKECTPTPNGMLCVLSAESIQTDIARYKPDVLIFNSGGLVPEDAAFTLMKEQKIISVGISLSDPDVYPYNGSVYAHKFDLFYTNSKHSYQHDYKKCSKIHLLPFAASTKHHYFLPDEKRIYDIVIVGHARPDRLAVVTELEKQFCVGTFGSGWPHSLGVVHGFEHIQAINRGKMYLSFAKTNAGFDNVKVGLFEAVACNQVVITKYMEELSDYFTIGSEIICYHSEKEIPDIVRGLLESPRKLEEIRANAYRRFLQEHTYGNRWMRVKKDIENSGKGCKENDRTNREYVQ